MRCSPPPIMSVCSGLLLRIQADASVPRWNQLDIGIVALSIMGITLEELKLSAALPINPTIIRIMRVLRIARGSHTHQPCPITTLKKTF